MTEPSWSGKPIIDRLTKLWSDRAFDEMRECAYGYLRDEKMTSLQKFRAIQTIIIRHPDHRAALPMIEEVRAELATESTYVKKVLSFYEENTLGRSDFTGLLPDAERGIAEEGREFLKVNPFDAESKRAASLMGRALTHDQAGREIMDALVGGRPMSVVRMGDGEGRFMLPLPPGMGTASRDIANRLWFRNGSFPSDEFWSALRGAYASADIVGVNPPLRIDLEYRNSLLGYVGVVNGNKFLEANRTNPSRRTVANWFLAQLGEQFFGELARRASEVHFIGPHPEMESKLLQLGARSAKIHLVPSDGVVESKIDRPHYPEVFTEIVAQIKERSGALWLVSAGAHAKIYCAEVRAAGGIAIDIGSLSDSWMGLKTR